MKMAYERPMMNAELYQANAYCVSSCDTSADNEQSLVGMNNVTLKNGMWFSIPKGYGGDRFGDSLNGNASYQQYGNLTFGGLQNPMTGTGGSEQYYWSTTSGDKTYHLEYSTGWTDAWHDTEGWFLDPAANGSYADLVQSGDQVFVLYEEDQSERDGALDAAVNTGDAWPGTASDGDNEGDWSNRFKFDNVLMGIVFRASQIFSYWS